MIFLPWNVVRCIEDAAYWADRECRAELIVGRIKNEDHYTNRFTSALRAKINAAAVPQLSADSLPFAGGVEQAVGADAFVILATDTHFKVGCFEAKWPRVEKSPTYAWDYDQGGTSHFSSQLNRQNMLVTQGYAVWEMFYNGAPFGNKPIEIPEETSMCVWHHRAINADLSRPGGPHALWTTEQLLKFMMPHAIGIGHIIRQICMCQAGTLQSRMLLPTFLQLARLQRLTLLIHYGAQPPSIGP